ncbi:hypothetical protein ANN_23604 [Periplaneta americana]|uniref:Reverse transcriptase domain-containing protein n=1 Tax=Periplaneta americana TaxID=6978 RepID=A0ABQ8SMM2_PERAM|nr:hypothetical protein ANN_23604 [Periplaneta americana]
MSPGSSTDSYSAFSNIALRKNLNQITCSDRDSNPGHLVSRPDALTVTPQNVAAYEEKLYRVNAVFEDWSVVEDIVAMKFEIITSCVKTDLMEEGANSSLSVARVNKTDSGNYTCSISPTEYATVTVHVLNAGYDAQPSRNESDQQKRRIAVQQHWEKPNDKNSNTTPSELWKNLKVIGLGRASEQADIPIPLDRLNEHFVKDPSLNDTTKQDTVLPDSVPPTRDKFYFTDVTPIDVMKAIRRIKTKAQGPDNISIILIQKIQEIVIPTIAHIFNSSLITSTFPKIWKQAFVLPLPKVKVPTDPNDYRPISILPAISKALERIVHRQITNYMNEHKLFDEYQSGFRAGHNTSTALLKVTEDIREAIDSNKVTILTLLDLSKAFNSVNFDLLTHKLRNMYLSETAVSWFESYLRERQQCVVSGNRRSSWLDITSGIPQGSVLGPLLFTIYVNDITSLVRHCNYHLYADDLQCYISSRLDRVNDAIDKLNEDIDSIVTWTKKLRLKINPERHKQLY